MAIKYFAGLLLVLIIAFIVQALIIQFTQTTSYEGPVTNHFDGKRFYNLGTYHKKTWRDTLRWTMGRQKAKWPEHVINTAIPDLAVPTKDEIKITFVNHATTLIQTSLLTILTDPVWSERVSPVSWAGPKRVRDPGVAFDKLPKIDVVLISHNHYDHLDLPILKKLNEKFHPTFLVPLGNKNFFNRHGIENVIEMDWWRSYVINTATIVFLPTQHWSARWINDKFKTLWGSYGITVGNKKIYFVGDTGYSNHFKEINQRWGKPDIALIPIGAYEPRWFMKDNHLNPEEAVKVHHDLAAKYSIPIHFGTFQLSDEAIDQPTIDLKKAIANSQLLEREFFILQVGESKVF
jgi:L-ascorbate metabolism protein UlaG (beta-lactamase superfamily)